MNDASDYRELVERALTSIKYPDIPADLYDPIRYTLRSGGKRIRPVLCLMACELFGSDPERALPAALSLEVFHNFTLLHDDIMDQSPMRRGEPSVYQKWNTNIAILSGDTMFALAYHQLFQLDNQILPDVLQIFSRTAIEVCEGQQFDMDFESMQDVSIADYLNMIRLKTAVLLAASLQIGAVCSGASRDEARNLYAFGENTGMAFQLKDDYLDAFGDELVFGKKTGSDIVSGKKTFLLLKAYELADKEQRSKLDAALAMNNDEDKVKVVLDIYKELGIREQTIVLIRTYHNRALENLSKLKAEGTEALALVAEQLLERVS